MSLFDDILNGYRGKTEASIKNNQNFTLATDTDGNRNPVWMCRYPVGDVTYPEVMNTAIDVFGTSDNQSAGTSHTHTIGLSNDCFAEGSSWQVPQNWSRGGYITISRTTVIDTVATVVSRDAGSINNVFLDILRENADGSLTRISSDNIGSSIAITNQTAYFELALSTPFVAQAGERYVVKFRNSCTTAITCYMRSIRRLDSVSSDSAFNTLTSTETARTDYTTAQATTARAAETYMGFAMLAAKNLPTSDKSYSDDANRVNVGGLWYQKASTGSFVIASSRFAFGGATNGNQNGIFIKPTSGDAIRADGDFWDTTATESGLIFCANRDFSQMGYLAVSNTGARILTGSSTSLTQRATFASEGNDVQWSVYYVPGSNSYTVLKDGVAQGSPWVDSGNVLAHSALTRYGGVRFERASSVNGGTIDNWTLRDWAP